MICNPRQRMQGDEPSVILLKFKFKVDRSLEDDTAINKRTNN